MINLYNQKEIKILKEGGKILSSILEKLKKETKEGVTGIDLNKRAMELILAKEALPSFLGYRKFPGVLCISINEELVHGIPKNRPIKKGDLVSLDLGIRYKGLCLDKSITFFVGEIDKKTKQFVKTVKKALDVGIKKARAGHRLGEISFAIQKTIEGRGYGVVTALSGHGVGKRIHEEPRIPNFGKKNDGPLLKEGMVLAIEPMACMGQGTVKVAEDGFTVVSADGSLTCHFEDTIVITKKGPQVLTRN